MGRTGLGACISVDSVGMDCMDIFSSVWSDAIGFGSNLRLSGKMEVTISMGMVP